MSSNDKTLCRLRWSYPVVNFAMQSTRTCCRTPSYKVDEESLKTLGKDALFNSPYLKERRFELLNGIKHSDCNSCWALEDSGIKSPRLGKEDFFYYINEFDKSEPEVLRKKIDNASIDSDLVKADKPRLLEISMGNTCDLKCSYCHYHYSTAWAKEMVKFGDIPKEEIDNEMAGTSGEFDTQFWKWFEEDAKDEVEIINFIGGEPLIIPKFYDFLEKLLEIYKDHDPNSRKVTISIVTNFNSNDQFINRFISMLPKLLDKFEVDLNLSMEALAERAEYIRFGLNWNKWNANLDKLLSQDYSKHHNELLLSFQVAINVLSISSLEEFLKFAKSVYDKYGIAPALRQNIVSFPDWQSPTILTEDYKIYLDNAIDYLRSVKDEMSVVKHPWGQWDHYIDFLGTVKEGIDTAQNITERRVKFFTWFREYDKRRNVNLVGTFPEMNTFHSSCELLFLTTEGN